tara:strand:- start:11156 stop:11956 length:801 start_codon:yes stop_codon:yes gene_type:complete
MILYPNAKINIGLNIIEKLNTGFHKIESCFIPISLYDIIEIHENKINKLSLSGIKIDGDTSENIIFKTLNKFRSNSKFKIHLHKNIPIGAGLGGGSSDAAFILKYLNEKFKEFNYDQLLNEANKIGSDCPFFIYNGSKYVTNTGNKFENINTDLSKKKIIIINPKISINTGTAFKNILPKTPKYNLKEVLENENIENWKKYIKNDFEDYVFSKIKSSINIKKYLFEIGAKFVGLSGSGSCIYGIFNEDELPQENIKFDSYIVDILN